MEKQISFMKLGKHVLRLMVFIILTGLVTGLTACEKGIDTTKQIKTSKRRETPAPSQKFRILHIMSYHSPWIWTDEQLRGFKDALKDLDIEYRVFQLDTKRISTNEWKEEIGAKARELIDTWKPDLVYTNDDNAQEYVTRHYINAEIPFVFSGVNKTPDYYGFVGSKNVAGVLEQEHFVETVRLLKKIIPGAAKIAVLTDEDITWEGVMQRMREKAPKHLAGTEFVSWDTVRTFEEYRQKIKDYHGKVDAVALLGIFNFRDENGDNVPFQDVLKWTAENSNVPDFSFWQDRVDNGTLCAVTVSGYNQGLAAGQIARGILTEGRSPSSYPFKPSLMGEPVISLARAKKMGINIDSGLLLSARVVNSFGWEE